MKCSSVLLEKDKLISFFLRKRTQLFLIGCVNVCLFSVTKRKLLETTAHLFSKSERLSDRKWRALKSTKSIYDSDCWLYFESNYFEFGACLSEVNS